MSDTELQCHGCGATYDHLEDHVCTDCSRCKKLQQENADLKEKFNELATAAKEILDMYYTDQDQESDEFPFAKRLKKVLSELK